MSFIRSSLTCITPWACRGLIVLVVFFNLRLYCSSPLAQTRDSVPPTLVAQLAANRSALDSGSPSEMQKLFPEGFYFSYLFHGLTWIELAIRDESYSEQAIVEAVDCLAKLESAEGRAPFPPNLPPDHGMFYSAWKCMLQAGIVAVQNGTDEDQLRKLRNDCNSIRDAIQSSRTPFLESYRGSAWPCDTVPAIHALSSYDRITGEDRYKSVIERWLKDALRRLDPQTDLLPHTAGLLDGQEDGVARATSQVIILRYLPDIDSAIAKDHYTKFRKRFLTSFVGAPCVLEYPSGVTGHGDVDSGPLIFGRSLVGTVMMMAIAQTYGDQSLADAIAISGETVGLPWTSGEKKNYAAGVMPIGNIIVAYAHVARPWFAGTEHCPDLPHLVSSAWRWKIHALSLLAFLPWFIDRRRRRKRTPLLSGEVQRLG